MRKKYFLIIILGIVGCMLITDELVPQPFKTTTSNLVYAMGPRPPIPPGPTPDRPPCHVPEPSTLLLLGTGALGIGVYLYRSRTRKK
jgi:hypothetical protein